MEKIEKELEELIKEYSELFNKYDFYVSNGLPENAYKAIDIGANMYIVFTDKDIKEKMTDLMKEFVKEENERIKNEKSN